MHGTRGASFSSRCCSVLLFLLLRYCNTAAAALLGVFPARKIAPDGEEMIYSRAALLSPAAVVSLLPPDHSCWHQIRVFVARSSC